jgi:hypothetical protein
MKFPFAMFAILKVKQYFIQNTLVCLSYISSDNSYAILVVSIAQRAKYGFGHLRVIILHSKQNKERNVQYFLKVYLL